MSEVYYRVDRSPGSRRERYDVVRVIKYDNGRERTEKVYGANDLSLSGARKIAETYNAKGE